MCSPPKGHAVPPKGHAVPGDCRAGGGGAVGTAFAAVALSWPPWFPASAPAWPRGPHPSAAPRERGRAARAENAEPGLAQRPPRHKWSFPRVSSGPRNVRRAQPHDRLRRGAPGARAARGEPERDREGAVGRSAGWGSCGLGLWERGADGEGRPCGGGGPTLGAWGNRARGKGGGQVARAGLGQRCARKRARCAPAVTGHLPPAAGDVRAAARRPVHLPVRARG